MTYRQQTTCLPNKEAVKQASEQNAFLFLVDIERLRSRFPVKISSSDYASGIHPGWPISAGTKAKPDKSWRKLRPEMSVARSHRDSRETRTAGGKAGKHRAEGRDPSLRWKGSNEGKEETSLPRNIALRLVSVKHYLSPWTLQRAELQWAGRCLGTLQCHSRTTPQEPAFTTGSVMERFRTSSATLPTLSPDLTCNSDTAQKAQMSTALYSPAGSTFS